MFISELISGVYGDVVRVKIMFNKQDSALVQFADAIQAHTGKPTHTRNCKLLSSEMPLEG